MLNTSKIPESVSAHLNKIETEAEVKIYIMITVYHWIFTADNKFSLQGGKNIQYLFQGMLNAKIMMPEEVTPIQCIF